MRIMNRIAPLALRLALALGPLTVPFVDAAPVHAQRRGDTETLSLELGEQTTISGTDVASYSEGTEGIVSVRYDERSANFVIAAQRVGVTSLLLIYNDGRQVRYRITVTDPAAGEGGPVGVLVRENIRLDMYFLQLTETYTHSLGIGWPTSFGGGTLDIAPNLSFNSRTDDTGAVSDTSALGINLGGTINQALPRLDLAQASGWGRIMRQAMLVTANGAEATLDTGGEINYAIRSGIAVDVRTIRYGSILTVTPRYDSATRRIEIALAADVSELRPASQADQPPGRVRTTVSTTVNLELGESIVLGGAVAQTTIENQGGLAGLSQIPILGVIFGTNNRLAENTENYLFIVPTVVESVPRSEADRITEVLDLYRSFGSIGSRGLGDIELVEPSPPGFE